MKLNLAKSFHGINWHDFSFQWYGVFHEWFTHDLSNVISSPVFLSCHPSPNYLQIDSCGFSADCHPPLPSSMRSRFPTLLQCKGKCSLTLYSHSSAIYRVEISWNDDSPVNSLSRHMMLYSIQWALSYGAWGHIWKCLRVIFSSNSVLLSYP